MEIPGLNLMSDEEWEKRFMSLTSKPERKARVRKPRENKATESEPEFQAKPIPVIQRGSGKLVPRTERAMMATAIDRGLEVGCTCRIERRAIAKDGSWILREVEKGTIVGVYASYFIVQIGNHRECFRWNEFWGDEHCKVKVRLKK